MNRWRVPALVLLGLLVCAASVKGQGAMQTAQSQRAALATQCNMTDLPRTAAEGPGLLGPIRFTNTSETQYAYFRFGNSSSGRPPLVLINGFASTITRWGVPLLRGLAEKQEVVIFDHNGQGFSRDLRANGAPSIQSIADDVMHLIRNIGLESPNILGWSMGGMVAPTLAARHGDLLGKVIVVAGAAGGPGSVSPANNIGQLTAGADSLLFPLDTLTGRAAWCAWQVGMLVNVQSPINPSTTLRETRAIIDFFKSRDVWDMLPAINNTVLLVGGADDQLVPAINLRLMAPRIKNVQLVMYSNSRHGVLFQDLKRFLGLVESFFSA